MIEIKTDQKSLKEAKKSYADYLKKEDVLPIKTNEDKTLSLDYEALNQELQNAFNIFFWAGVQSYADMDNYSTCRDIENSVLNDYRFCYLLSICDTNENLKKQALADYLSMKIGILSDMSANLMEYRDMINFMLYNPDGKPKEIKED